MGDCGSSERKHLTMAQYSFLLALSACPPPSLMVTLSPSRPSTASMATPSTDLMGLELGVWDQQGLGTTLWSPVPTLSTGATIMQAEPSKFQFCFIVNSNLIFM